MQAVLSSLLLAAPIGAQELLLDIYQGDPLPYSSTPAHMIAFDGALIMQGALAGLGDEVVRWDGAQATLVADVLVGPDGSDPRDFTVAGDQVFFIARSAGKGRELWVSDGVSGAELVVDLATGAGSGTYEELVGFGDLLVFTASHFFFGAVDLYRSDGTPAGTVAFDLAAQGISGPQYLTEFDGRVLMNAWSAETGREIWSTDGVNFQLEADLVPGEADSFPGAFTPFGGELYFLARDLLGGTAIWRTDGEIFEVALGSDVVIGPSGLQIGGDYLYYTALDALGEREMWRTDGTLAGTVQLTQLGSDAEIADVYATDIGVFFTADDGLHGRELYFSDGTAGGLQFLQLGPHAEEPGFSGFAALPGGLAFIARLSGGDDDVWFSDGTLAGTQIVANFDHPDDADPEALTAVGNVALFSGWDDQAGNELFVTDGTLAGTGLLADLDPTTTNGSSAPGELTDFNGSLFFAATAPGHGREPWISDGTPAGTFMLRDLAPGPGDSSPDDPTPFQDRLIFSSSVANRGLWVTDGTSKGTLPIVGDNVSSPTLMYAASDRVYFSARTESEGVEPWTTDGTLAGTQLLADLNPGEEHSVPNEFLELQDGTVVFTAVDAEGRGLYATDGSTVERLTDGNPAGLARFGAGATFASSDDENGRELWVTDGTLAGTQLFVDVNPGPDGSTPSEIFVVGERFFFEASVPEFGRELWVSNGSVGGTQLAVDLTPGTAGSDLTYITPFGNRLLFAGALGESNSLWITDGTEAGTDLLLDLSQTATGPSIGIQDGIVVAGDVAWFEVNDDNGTAKLWQTDGTLAGTQLVIDPDPFVGTVGDKVSSKTSVGGDETLIFRGVDPLAGAEPWISDGTSPGTRVLADLELGPADSNPSTFRRAGATIFFIASGHTTGRELYSVPFAATESWAIEPYGVGCPGTGDLVPELSAVGPAVLGGTLSIALNDAAPSAPAGLFVSFERLALPLGGSCSLYVGPPLEIATALTTDLLGSAGLAAPIPTAPSLAGVPLHLQFAAVDAQALLGATLTRGLEVLLGP